MKRMIAIVLSIAMDLLKEESERRIRSEPEIYNSRIKNSVEVLHSLHTSIKNNSSFAWSVTSILNVTVF